MSNVMKMVVSMIITAILFSTICIYFQVNAEIITTSMHTSMLIIVCSAMVQKIFGTKLLKGKNYFDEVANELDVSGLDARRVAFLIVTFLMYLSFGVLAGVLVLSVVYQ